MNWLRKCASNQNALFTAVDPADFYEWKISGIIPKGSRFSKFMPPSEVFAKGLVIATASLPTSCLTQVKDTSDLFEISEDTDIDVQFYVGSAATPSEVLDKYHRIKRDFAEEIEHFKRTAISQTFIVSPRDDKVYKLSDKNGKAHIDEYDVFPEIQKQLIVARRKITQESQTKKWRSYEMEKLRRFENVFVMINNKNTIVDPTSISSIFVEAEIKPLRSSIKSWEDYYISVSDDAKVQHDRLQALDQMQWIKAAERL